MLPLAWIPLYQALDDGEGDPLSSLQTSVPFFGAAFATCGTACGLVLIAAAWRWRNREAPISQVRVWHRAFVSWKPPENDKPYLTVELKNGTVWRGSLLAFDSDPEDDQRTIALGTPLFRRRPLPYERVAFTTRGSKDRNIFKPVVGQYEVVILAEGDIRSIQVAYPST